MTHLLATLALASTLAYRPFLDPAPGAAQWWWLTIIPLSVLISMVYKAGRINTLDDMQRYWKRVAIMSAQVIALMIGLAAALHIVVEFIVPLAG